MNTTDKTSSRLIRNTVFSYGGYFGGLLISLFLTPFIIAHIGIAQYGLFILVEVIIGTFSLLDVTGINTSYITFIAEAHARKDYDRLNRIIVVGTGFYAAFWLLICTAAFFLKLWILHFFKIPASSMPLAASAFSAILAVTFLLGTLSVFRSVLLGLQRFDLTSGILIIAAVINATGIIVLLSLGFGFKGLLIMCIVNITITLSLQIIGAFHICPSLRKIRPVFDIPLFKETFRFGMQVQIARMGELINAQVDKILIGHFLSVSMVGFYEVGAKVATVAQSFPIQLLKVISPASTELNTLGKRTELLKLYYRASKYCALITFPLTCYIVAHGHAVILLWIGKPGFNLSVLTMKVLCVGSMLYILSYVGRSIVRGMGFPVYEMRSGIVITVLNISLSLILIIKIGFTGALLGTAIATSIGALYFISTFHRHIKENMVQKLFLNTYFIPATASIIAAGLSLIPQMLWHSVLCGATRLHAAYTIGASGIVFLIFFALIIHFSRYLDAFDYSLVKRAFQMLPYKFKEKTTPIL